MRWKFIRLNIIPENTCALFHILPPPEFCPLTIVFPATQVNRSDQIPQVVVYMTEQSSCEPLLNLLVGVVRTQNARLPLLALLWCASLVRKTDRLCQPLRLERAPQRTLGRMPAERCFG